eukprot:TRINITY_DN14647_c0_g1_i2.p1 TRINITY_DN14647_c0_g1~~TRINITY_DN14647_c0_g1_i2.p1  ORF type:complete len:257 (-),score=28.92 TRINITY_DN14647_c0_g1_i2:115-885(-)
MLFALNATTGQVREEWSQAITDTACGPPVVWDGIAYFMMSNLFAISVTDGAGLWTVPGTSSPPTSPVVADGILLVNMGGGVHAFNAKSGALQWNASDDDVWGSPVVALGVAYIVSNKGIFAHKLQTGELLFSKEEFRVRDPMTPAFADGRLFVTGAFSQLVALNASNGETLWVQTEGVLGYHLWAVPTVVDGVVYVGGNGGILVALDAVTGAMRWNVTYDQPTFVRSPVVANGRVYVGVSSSPDGRSQSRLRVLLA